MQNNQGRPSQIFIVPGFNQQQFNPQYIAYQQPIMQIPNMSMNMHSMGYNQPQQIQYYEDQNSQNMNQQVIVMEQPKQSKKNSVLVQPVTKKKLSMVTQNQVKANNVSVIQNSNLFRSSAIVAMCPTCHTSAMTVTDMEFNWNNYWCYFLTTPVLWIPFQLFRGKDVNCNNAKHYCSKCSALIANYDAC